MQDYVEMTDLRKSRDSYWLRPSGHLSLLSGTTIAGDVRDFQQITTLDLRRADLEITFEGIRFVGGTVDRS